VATPHIDGSRIYFQAYYNSTNTWGLYSTSGTDIVREIDSLPSSFPFGGGGRLRPGYGIDGIDNGNILIGARDTLVPGKDTLYLRYDGEWHILLREGDTLDGATVVEITDAAFSGDMVGFRAKMADGTFAIYSVLVPEPSSVLVATVGCAGTVRRNRRRN
jgi:hypothetical protein